MAGAAGLRPVDPDRAGAPVRAAADAWLRRMEIERRASPHTLAAYRRDLAAALDFFTEHLGGPPDLKSASGTLRLQKSVRHPRTVNSTG